MVHADLAPDIDRRVRETPSLVPIAGDGPVRLYRLLPPS